MAHQKYPYKTITPGTAKRWSYIIEGRTSQGWVAIGDIKLYTPHVLHALNRTVDLSHQAAMTSLRMDLLNATLNTSERISKTECVWPDDASEWAKENLRLMSLRVKKPDTAVIKENHRLVGSRVSKAAAWAQRIHHAAGYPTMLTDVEALSKDILLPTAQKMQTIHNAHDILKDLRAAQSLIGETRVILIEKHREDDPYY